MNLSLTNRVKLSFILANIVVLVTGFLMYFFLGSLADITKNSWDELQRIREIDEIVRTDIVDITARSIRSTGSGKGIQANLISLKGEISELSSNLERLKGEYSNIESRALLQRIIENVKTLDEYVANPSSQETRDRFRDSSFHVNLVGKVSVEFSAYVKLSQKRNLSASKKMQDSIAAIKKNMLLVLILAFLGTIILGWLVPHKVALPFKKINHAISELQDCNFDVSISYDEKDEIGELSLELNKMIAQLKKHEELRSDKFILESKKFNIIANHFGKNILVVNSEGRLSYMNNAMYSILRTEMSDVIDREIEDTLIPESIVSIFEKVLKRRGKVENEDVEFSYKIAVADDEFKKVEYKGYADVYPIRGKESSLDYYLMVIHEEIKA